MRRGFRLVLSLLFFRLVSSTPCVQVDHSVVNFGSVALQSIRLSRVHLAQDCPQHTTCSVELISNVFSLSHGHVSLEGKSLFALEIFFVPQSIQRIENTLQLYCVSAQHSIPDSNHSIILKGEGMIPEVFLKILEPRYWIKTSESSYKQFHVVLNNTQPDVFEFDEVVWESRDSTVQFETPVLPSKSLHRVLKNQVFPVAVLSLDSKGFESCFGRIQLLKENRSLLAFSFDLQAYQNVFSSNPQAQLVRVTSLFRDRRKALAQTTSTRLDVVPVFNGEIIQISNKNTDPIEFHVIQPQDSSLAFYLISRPEIRIDVARNDLAKGLERFNDPILIVPANKTILLIFAFSVNTQVSDSRHHVVFSSQDQILDVFYDPDAARQECIEIVSKSLHSEFRPTELVLESLMINRLRRLVSLTYLQVLDSSSHFIGDFDRNSDIRASRRFLTVLRRQGSSTGKDTQILVYLEFSMYGFKNQTFSIMFFVSLQIPTPTGLHHPLQIEPSPSSPSLISTQELTLFNPFPYPIQTKVSLKSQPVFSIAPGNPLNLTINPFQAFSVPVSMVSEYPGDFWTILDIETNQGKSSILLKLQVLTPEFRFLYNSDAFDFSSGFQSLQRELLPQLLNLKRFPSSSLQLVSRIKLALLNPLREVMVPNFQTALIQVSEPRLAGLFSFNRTETTGNVILPSRSLEMEITLQLSGFDQLELLCDSARVFLNLSLRHADSLRLPIKFPRHQVCFHLCNFAGLSPLDILMRILMLIIFLTTLFGSILVIRPEERSKIVRRDQNLEWIDKMIQQEHEKTQKCTRNGNH